MALRNMLYIQIRYIKETNPLNLISDRQALPGRSSLESLSSCSSLKGRILSGTRETPGALQLQHIPIRMKRTRVYLHDKFRSHRIQKHSSGARIAKCRNEPRSRDPKGANVGEQSLEMALLF